MKWLIPGSAVFLSGCSPTPHHFRVDVGNADGHFATASVTLCGKPLGALQRSGDTFAGTVAVNCEGSGYVRLRSGNGTTVDCPIGYVTLVEDRWDFAVRGRSCTKTLKAAG
jgi:hypothetical protein